MAYVLNQYNYNTNSSSSNFMTYITDGTVDRRSSSKDDPGSAIAGGSIFKDECIIIPAGMTPNNNYYFHCKIKRMTSSDQTFNIKLMQNDITSAEEIEQYIKTITIAKGIETEWVDVEFIFNPYDNYDIIMFELRRTADDQRLGDRYPKIIYEELSIINNIIPGITGGTGVEFIKLGIQSRPGLLMCINGEEIRIGRTGIYEIKNGIILVSFFSVVAGGTESTSAVADAMNDINIRYAAAEAIPDFEQRQAAIAAINSECYFGSSKTRVIDSFALDYLYREE